MSFQPKPVLLDHLDAKLGARVVELIADDNERAQKRKAARAKKRAKKAGEKPSPRG